MCRRCASSAAAASAVVCESVCTIYMLSQHSQESVNCSTDVQGALPVHLFVRAEQRTAHFQLQPRRVVSQTVSVSQTTVVLRPSGMRALAAAHLNQLCGRSKIVWSDEEIDAAIAVSLEHVSSSCW